MSFGVQGINPDGSMTWPTSQQWIDALNAHNYLGHSDWRMPHSDSEDTQDYYRKDAEMGELFYTELGSQAGSTILRTHDREESWFHNFQPYLYWSDTEVLDTQGKMKPMTHETFSLGNGLRSGNTDPNELYVIPVFDGLPSFLPSESNGPERVQNASTLTTTPGDNPVANIANIIVGDAIHSDTAAKATCAMNRPESDTPTAGKNPLAFNDSHSLGIILGTASAAANSNGRSEVGAAGDVSVNVGQANQSFADVVMRRGDDTDGFGTVGPI
jgi:hypothetical protein